MAFIALRTRDVRVGIVAHVLLTPDEWPVRRVGDWVANGVLFALYLHVPRVIPQAPLDTFIVAYPSKRYRSALIGIIVHSSQSVVFTALAVAVVLK